MNDSEFLETYMRMSLSGMRADALNMCVLRAQAIASGSEDFRKAVDQLADNWRWILDRREARAAEAAESETVMAAG